MNETMDPNHTWEDIAGEYEVQCAVAKARVLLLAEALGDLLAHLGVVEKGVCLTGPQLLTAARDAIEQIPVIPPRS